MLYRREIDEAMRPVSVILSQWGFHDIEGSVAVIGQPFPEHDPVLVVRFEVADARDEEAPDRIIVVHVAGQGGGTRPSACRQRCWFRRRS